MLRSGGRLVKTGLPDYDSRLRSLANFGSAPRMISTLRRLVVDSWLGRIIALLIFLAFVGWGVGDMVGSYGGNQINTAVTVGARRITAQDLDSAIRSELPQVARQMGVGDPSQLQPGMRQQVAQSVLQRLLAQNEVLALADRNGMKVPDALVREEIFGMSYFHGTNGQFDRALMNRKLAQIGMSERELLNRVRDDIAARNLLEGLGNTAIVPASVIDQVLTFNTQEHIVDLLRIDSNAMAVPALPDEAQLHRFYDLHPSFYSTPEYRHARMVLLSTDTIAHGLEIPDETLKQAYELEIAKYDVPQTRNIEVLTFENQHAAKAAADAWKVESDWSTIQNRDSSAAAVTFPNARQSDIPSPELSRAVFSASVGSVTGPIQTETGWVIFRVTAIQPPHKTGFEDARAELRSEMARAQAPQLLSARVASLQDVIAGSSDLDQIPSNLGAVPAQGTLDAQGMTRDAELAPVPGDDETRKAVIARIFLQKKGEKPSLVNGPKGSAFAVLVDGIEPGHVKPYDLAREQVAQDWRKAQQRHLAEQHATQIMLDARKRGSLVQAVGHADGDAAVRQDLAVSRMKPGGFASDLLSLVLTAPKGKTGMVTVGDDVFVFTITGLRTPPAESVRSLRDSMKGQLQDVIHADIPTVFVRSLEDEAKPKPNMTVLQKVLNPGSEEGVH